MVRSLSFGDRVPELSEGASRERRRWSERRVTTDQGATACGSAHASAAPCSSIGSERMSGLQHAYETRDLVLRAPP